MNAPNCERNCGVSICVGARKAKSSEVDSTTQGGFAYYCSLVVRPTSLAFRVTVVDAHRLWSHSRLHCRCRGGIHVLGSAFGLCPKARKVDPKTTQRRSDQNEPQG